MPEFKDRLKEARESKGLTQGDLARAIGVTEGALSKMERGKILRPSSKTLMKLSSELDREASWFVPSDQDPVTSKRRKPDAAASRGHRTARDAALDREHYLWHFLDLYDYATDTAKAAIADRMDKEFEFETVTPLLARTWLNGIKARRRR